MASSNRDVSNLDLKNVSTDGAGSVGIEVTVRGGGNFEEATVSGAQTASKISAEFQARKGGGNSGW